jgi:N-acetylglucosaminyldiphosphoundecaprenol N-acetyl-beta-D-mannosaminyltransferase
MFCMEISTSAQDPLTGDMTMIEALRLVNVPTEAALLQAVADCFAAGRGFAISTLNLDHMVKLRQNPAFRAAYRAQTQVVADGNPIVWLSRLAGRSDVRLVPGSEVIAPLCALAANHGVPVAFLGSTAPVLQAAARQLQIDHPGLKVAACQSPAFGFDPASAAADAMLDQIAASGAKLCFLALGAPKQEILAARGLARHPSLGFISIGAGLDFIAGHQIRAPLWVRSIAMEWLWRMATNPKRLARRYLDCALILPGLAGAALTERRLKGQTKP